MKQPRIRQLLNIYRTSYTNRERWQKIAWQALEDHHRSNRQRTSKR